MKMFGNRILAIILTIVIFAFGYSGVSANTRFKSDNQIAVELKDHGILVGSDCGIDLEAEITRNEMIVLLIRLLGKEKDIDNYNSTSLPFTDISPWASKYIKCAYADGLTTGTSMTTFSGSKKVTLYEVETFILRALGYEDGKDFSYKNTETLIKKIGIRDNIEDISYSNFIERKSLNRMVMNALYTNLKDESRTLLDKLNEIKDRDFKTKFVVGYLPDWSGDYYKKLDFSALTHINIAFVNPDSTGKLSSNFDGTKINDIVSLASNNDVKVLASLGGAGYADEYLALTKDYNSIKNFNNQIIEYLKKYNYDGVDIDVEGDIDKSFWKNYDMWIGDLKSKCDANNMLLTTAVGKWYASNIEDKTFERFDFVSIMAYDNNTSKSNHSSFDYLKSNTEYFNKTRNIPKEKLVLGVPFYGYSYNKDGSMNWNSSKTYKEILALDKNNKYKDNAYGYGYNGVETIKKKTSFANDYKGIMIWSLNQDGDLYDSLLGVIKDNIDR